MYIALSGKMRSGKDASKDIIIDLLSPNKIVIANFSDPLYEVLKITCDNFDIPYEKDREFLQFLGTNYARRRNPDVFVNIMKKKVDAIQQYKDLSIIVPDIRFPNEADMLRQAGFYLLRIERPDEQRLTNMCIEEIQHREHESEKALKHYKFDYTITNNSTLDDLKVRIKTVLSSLQSI